MLCNKRLLLDTRSIFLAIGMPQAEVLHRAKATPAMVLRQTKSGTLTPHSVADITISQLQKRTFAYTDFRGSDHRGGEKLCLTDTIDASRLVPVSENA